MTTTTPRTVALYWHNGRSLGHTSRTAKVARYLLRSEQPYSIAGITGAWLGLDLLPAEVDIVKIPSFANFDDPTGWHLRARLAMDYDDPSLRAAMDLEGVRRWHPGDREGYASLKTAMQAQGLL